MTPKSLLRLPEARSNIDEMTGDTEFQRLIADSGPAAENASGVTKLFFSSGKIYYDLAKERADKNLQASVAIARLEQVTCVHISFYIIKDVKKSRSVHAILCGKPMPALYEGAVTLYRLIGLTFPKCGTVS